MNTHERAKRFKKAREEYNQHGYQSMRTVDEETGISKSTIAKLENEEDQTKVNYIDIVKLAEHYGVSVAWLMEQSESYSLDESSQTVTKTTGLSAEAINMLQSIKRNKQLLDSLNLLLESKGFWEMVSQFSKARIINANSTQSDEQAELIEGLQDFGVINGMESKNSRLSDRQLIDLYLWRASQDIGNTLRQALKGDKENG